MEPIHPARTCWGVPVDCMFSFPIVLPLWFPEPRKLLSSAVVMQVPSWLSPLQGYFKDQVGVRMYNPEFAESQPLWARWKLGLAIHLAQSSHAVGKEAGSERWIDCLSVKQNIWDRAGTRIQISWLLVYCSIHDICLLLKKSLSGFPGGAVVENLPANAEDTGSSPGLGRFHMPRSN